MYIYICIHIYMLVTPNRCSKNYVSLFDGRCCSMFVPVFPQPSDSYEVLTLL